MCSASCKPKEKAMGSSMGDNLEKPRSPLVVALYMSSLMQTLRGHVLLNSIGEYSAFVTFNWGNH